MQISEFRAQVDKKLETTVDLLKEIDPSIVDSLRQAKRFDVIKRRLPLGGMERDIRIFVLNGVVSTCAIKWELLTGLGLQKSNFRLSANRHSNPFSIETSLFVNEGQLAISRRLEVLLSLDEDGVISTMDQQHHLYTVPSIALSGLVAAGAYYGESGQVLAGDIYVDSGYDKFTREHEHRYFKFDGSVSSAETKPPVWTKFPEQPEIEQDEIRFPVTFLDLADKEVRCIPRLRSELPLDSIFSKRGADDISFPSLLSGGVSKF